MNRRAFLRSLAALGVAVPTAALASRASARTLESAIQDLDGTPWWQPVLQAWRDGTHVPALDAFCRALDVPDGTECAALDVAVARLLLGGIQDELPAWSTFGERGFVTARPPFPRRLDGTPLFEPELALSINWASSGPGFDWPEAYYVTHVRELGIHVVTASRDSEDAWGCTDHALGWRSDEISDFDAVCAIIQADWQARFDRYDQGLFEEVLSGGFVGGAALAKMTSTVWASSDTYRDDDD